MMRNRVGFTLVELLVVIAIIGILVAMLLPAVQAAREAAHRMQCSNQVKQLALGLHNFHAAHKMFPAGGLTKQALKQGNPCFSTEEHAGLQSWTVAILPYIEQQNVYDKLNLKEPIPSSDQGLNPLVRGHATNQFIYSQPMPIYRCPSHPSGSALNGGPGGVIGLAYTPSYVGVMGGSATPTNVSPTPAIDAIFHCRGGSTTTRGISNNGPLVINGKVEIGHIRDGSTNTFLIGESRYVTWRGTGENDGRNFSWSSSMNPISAWPVATVLATAVDPINMHPPGSGADYNSQSRGFSSYHPGGAHFALCDGSVHFVSENMDTQVYQSMGKISDGLPIGNPFE